MILFFKAKRPGIGDRMGDLFGTAPLIPMPVQVDAYTKKDGTQVKAHTEIRKVRVEKPKSPAPLGSSGPFGPIFHQFYHDAQGAIAYLKEHQTGEAVAALHHPEVGDIDLAWGSEGTNRNDGSGLAKLIAWHPEVLDDLQGFVSSLSVKQRDKKRVQLWDGADRRAVVKLTYDDQRKHWLLTAYEKEGTGRATRTDTDALGGEGDTPRLSSSPTESLASVSAPGKPTPPPTHTSSDGEPLWATPERHVYTDADGAEVEDRYAVPVIDNQGRNLEATKRHQDLLTREHEEGRKRSAADYAESLKVAPEAVWTRVAAADGTTVDVLRSGQSRFVAVPATGRQSAKTFQVIDLDGKEQDLPQIDKGDVRSWLRKRALREADEAKDTLAAKPTLFVRPAETPEVTGADAPEPATPVAPAVPGPQEGATKTVSRFELGRSVTFALPKDVGSLRPSAADLKHAAVKLGITVAEARRALDAFNDPDPTSNPSGRALVIFTPQEGDTKTEAGVTYTLRGGRWHRDTPEPMAPPSPPQTTDIPDALLKLRGKVNDLGGRQKTAETMKTALRGRDTKDKASTLIDSLAEGTNASRDQVLAELGLRQVEKAPVAAPKPTPVPAADTGTYDDLDPSSPNYRYRDTGYVAGSRKEDAAKMLRQAKRDGAQVRGTAIDWDVLEQNPREAKEVITKSHLFGAVDWDGLKANGMEPGAGFLVDRIYAAVGTEPTDDTPQARQDYTLGLESLRDRLETCKTPDEVTQVLTEIRDEWEGINLNEAEAREYADLGERRKTLVKPYYAAREHSDALAKEADRFANAARALEYKKRRTPDEEKDWAVLKVQASEAWDKVTKFRAANPYFFEKKKRDLGGGWSADDSDAEWDSRQLFKQQDAVVAAAKVRNALESPVHRAWAQMGERFINLLNYRKFKGSDAFAKHVANAKGGRMIDWSWAEKEAKAAPRGASEESTRFQLLVADSYERQGGRQVHADSTDALKRAFGLREVQSGNWVLRDLNSAKFHVEQTAGAFADLADLIGAKDQQIAMNGRLALAFGARGHGNTGFGGAARAHYEPVERIINLTKMGGGGSLAHEWFHALDNLLSEAMGGKAGADTFLTEDPLNLPAGELRDAFTGLRSALLDGPHRVSRDMIYTGEDYRAAKHNIERTSDYGMPAPAKLIRDAGNIHAAVQAVDAYFATVKQTRKNIDHAKRWRTIAAAYHGGEPAGGVVRVEAGPAMSDFRREAVLLDKGDHGKYWSSARELAARAFQAWAEDRLAGQGRRNDYLSAKADNKFYVSPFGSPKPFPEGDERERTNAAFDRLMGVIAKGDLLAKALASVDGPRVLFFKSRGWFGPEHGGTHRKQAPHEDGKDLGGGKPEPSVFAPDPQQADAYRQQLARALASKKTLVAPVTVGETTAVLRALGAPAFPMTISRDVVRKAINGVKHQVPLTVIDRLPESLADPVMVFDSATVPGALVALVGAVDDHRQPVVVALHLSAQQQRHVVNAITSVHGRPHDQIMRWAKQGLLRYRNEKKSLAWLQYRGLQLPKEGARQGSERKILTEADVVKLRRDGRYTTGPVSDVASDSQPSIRGTDTSLAGRSPTKLNKSIAPCALFFKAQRRDAKGTEDMFGEAESAPAPAAKVEKEVQHKGQSRAPA